MSKLTQEQAALFLKRVSGSAPGLFISFELIEKCDFDLLIAAFISQSAWLAANASGDDGWFFLGQAGPGSATKGIYEKIGSWENVGISEKAQRRIRGEMIERGWLAELPSWTASGRGETVEGNSKTAFMFIQRRGTPPRLYYKVDLPRYVQFLST